MSSPALAPEFERYLQSCCVPVSSGGGDGTGFFVAPGVVLTNGHVVKNAAQADVAFEGKTWKAGVKHSPQGADLALLEISQPPAHPCVYLGDDVAVPDFCYTFGFVKGGIPQPATVEVEGVVGGEIQLKAGVITFGKSGSPLLNLRTSTVCGIIRSTRDAYQPVGGRALSTGTVLSEFPQIREQHDDFHGRDDRWRTFASERGDLSGGLVHLPIPPKPFLAHPYAEQSNFTGRIAEQEMLTQWLEDPEKPVLTLTAIGGMGKSALTWFWLNRHVLANSHGLAGMVWWSFYEANAKFDVFVLNAIAYTRRFDMRVIVAPPYERMQALLSVLTERRYLIVFDGYERETIAYSGAMAAYQGDEMRNRTTARHVGASNDTNAAAFLRGLAARRGGSKLLVTSRLFPNDLAGSDAKPLAGCRQVDLAGMHPDDVPSFFRAQGVLNGTPEQIDGLARRYDYHPLSLRLLTGMVANDLWKPGDIAVAEKGIAARDIINREHHILEITYDALSDEARQFLSRIAAFQAPMNREALTTLNTYDSEEKFDLLLRELIDRGFVWRDRRSQRFDLHPIVRGYAYDRLTDKTGAHSNARKYFGQIPIPDTGKVRSIEDFDSVFELYHHTIGSGGHVDAFELLKNRLTEPVYYTLGATGRYLILVEALWDALPGTGNLDILPPWKQLSNWSMYAWVMNSLAVAYSRTGQPIAAVKLFEELARRDAIFPGEDHTTTLTLLADDLVSLGRLSDAEKALRQAIEEPLSRFKTTRHSFAKECASLQLARVRWLLGAPDAVPRLKEAIATLSENEELRGIVTRDPAPIFDADRYVAIGRRMLAEFHMESSPATALELAESSHAYASKRDVAVDLCSSEIMLGRAQSALGRHDLADGLIAGAVVRARNGGMMELDIAASLALVENRIRGGFANDVEHLIEGAEESINSGSYGLYAVDAEILRIRLAVLRGEIDAARKKLKSSARGRRGLAYAPAARALAALRAEIGM